MLLFHLLCFRRLPSNESKPTNKVSTTPNTQTTLDLKNFANLSSCILSDIFDTIESDVATNVIGIITAFIKFPIKVIRNNKIGCNKFTEAILPVLNIKVVRSGIKQLEKFTKLLIEVFTIVITSAKLVKLRTMFNIY